MYIGQQLFAIWSWKAPYELRVVSNNRTINQAATHDIQRISGHHAQIERRDVREVVRVVDCAGIDLARAIFERDIARGAPHLIAARYLKDAHAAFGTALGFLLDRLGGGDAVGVASVILCLGDTDDLVAIRTGELLAELALILGGEVSAAVAVGTGHDELLALADDRLSAAS